MKPTSSSIPYSTFPSHFISTHHHYLCLLLLIELLNLSSGPQILPPSNLLKKTNDLTNTTMTISLFYLKWWLNFIRWSQSSSVHICASLLCMLTIHCLTQSFILPSTQIEFWFPTCIKGWFACFFFFLREGRVSGEGEIIQNEDSEILLSWRCPVGMRNNPHPYVQTRV